MSSRVRASAAVSGPPDSGIDVEKSPRPSRSRGRREQLEGPDDAARQQQRREHRQQAEDECGPRQALDEAVHGRVDARDRQARLDQRDTLASRRR